MKAVINKKALAILVATILFFSNRAISEEGVIVADDYRCNGDHMAIETWLGYTLAEWYSGSLLEGMYVYGDLHGYGFTNLYDSEEDYENGDNDIGYVYIDDYSESRSEATDWCFND